MPSKYSVNISYYGLCFYTWSQRQSDSAFEAPVRHLLLDILLIPEITDLNSPSSSTLTQTCSSSCIS